MQTIIMNEKKKKNGINGSNEEKKWSRMSVPEQWTVFAVRSTYVNVNAPQLEIIVLNFSTHGVGDVKKATK